jgi:hypothetical protein
LWGKARFVVETSGIFSTKDEATKKIRFGTDVGCGVSGGTGIGDILGSADGIEGRGGK